MGEFPAEERDLAKIVSTIGLDDWRDLRLDPLGGKETAMKPSQIIGMSPPPRSQARLRSMHARVDARACMLRRPAHLHNDHILGIQLTFTQMPTPFTKR